MDIDKAYIMGQSFDNGIYVGWSDLFDYSTHATLEASKTLPLPQQTTLQQRRDTKYNIDNELNDIINTISKVGKLRKLANLIYKVVTTNKGFYNYDTSSAEKNEIFALIKRHENTNIKSRQRTSAYKNSASANIYNISHSIRNRDLAYSDITMRDLRKSADNSPKGLLTKALNSFNPFSKYIMLYLNLVGKDVIGIAANGEKVWFNLTYYYHKILRNGTEKDKLYIKMAHKFNRIAGRAKLQLSEKLIKHIPDIGQVDVELKTKIKQLFYNDSLYSEIPDIYVDLLISQLLSAATDNAKELILAKINAGTNLAKYHLHLMILGFSLDDIVAFMTSPVIELIDAYTAEDCYTVSKNDIKSAVNMLKGQFNLNTILKNEALHFEDSEAQADYYEALAEAAEALAEEDVALELNSNVINLFRLYYKIIEAKSLNHFIEIYTLYKIGYYNINNTKKEKLEKIEQLNGLKLSELKSKNYNINFLFKTIDSFIDRVNSEIQNYRKLDPEYSIDNFYEDLTEFETLTELANETTTFASSWLKLNMGIPQVDEELIELLKKMKNSVTTRESAMKIKHHFLNKKLFLLDDDISGISEESVKKQEQERIDNNKKQKEALINCIQNVTLENLNTTTNDSIYKEIKEVIKTIMGNNPELGLDYIKGVLINSVKAELYGNFDLFKFLRNDNVVLPASESTIPFNFRRGDIVSYRELAADYYNLLKSSWNILDFINKSETYKQTIDLLNYTTVSRNTLSTKSKMINELIELGEIKKQRLSKKEYLKIMQFADKVIINSFFFAQEPILIPRDMKYRKMFNKNYQIVEGDELVLNSLNGIDSLKYFMENGFVDWLKTKYKNEPLAQPLLNLLTLSSNFGKPLLRTTLNLLEIDQNLSNKNTYNEMIASCEFFATLKFADTQSITSDKRTITVLDMLILYNLAVNGTKLGGKYLTALFSNFAVPGSILYEYYKFLGNLDNAENKKYVLPTKLDFLINIAPTVSSQAALALRTEPYVKVKNSVTGFDIYHKTKLGYKPYNPITFDLDLSLTPEEKNLCLYNYSNAMALFPQLHRKLDELKAISLLDVNKNEARLLLQKVLTRYIRENRVLIYKIC